MNRSLKAILMAFCLWLTLTAVAAAAPAALSDTQMAGVTGQKGLQTDENRPDNSPRDTFPSLEPLQQLHMLEQTLNRDRALSDAAHVAHVAHVAHDFVTIHKSLFAAPEAVSTILAAPTAIVGGFFF